MRLSCSVFGLICLQFLATPGFAQQGPANVVVVPIVQREVAAGQTFVGQVLPSRRSIVGSAVDGRVVELMVNDGERVGLVSEGEPARKIGQPLAQLLTETISIEIDAAKASAELRRQELAEMQAGTRAEELAQVLARMEGSQALMDYTKSQFDRVKKLFEVGNSVTKQDLDEAVANAINAQKNHASAKAAHEMAVKGPRPEQMAQAQARLEIATQEVRRLEDQRNKYTIRAPFEGYVIAKLTEVGAWVSRGDPIAEVIALDPAEIEVTVPEAYIAHVRVKSAVVVRIEALGTQSFTGEVARVVPQADLRSRSFPIKIRVANPSTEDSHAIKAGMLARVTLPVGPKKQALLVPKDALVLGGPSPAVMAVGEDDQKQTIAVAVNVQLGVVDGDLIEVIGDLKPNQRVIVVGNERVRAGQPVLATAAPVRK